MTKIGQNKFFGTDGIRGTAGTAPITPDFLQFLACVVGNHAKEQHPHRRIHGRVVVGKDTRLSGYTVEPSLASGFCAVGLDVLMVGPMPAAGVALLTQSLKADLGVMVSASHNPFWDNGVKFFDHLGRKFDSEREAKIEELLTQSRNNIQLASGAELGRAQRLEDARGRYMEYVKRTLPRKANLEGMKIALDCANGAAWRIAPQLFWELGAEVITLGTAPNGTNINENCGAVHPENLCKTVIKEKCHAGIALDGDADRIVLINEKGEAVDGDTLLTTLADIFIANDNLTGKGIVGTELTNSAVEQHLNKQSLKMIRAKVGDRFVAESMRKNNMNLGGEPSGHIIMNDFADCSDAISTALTILTAVNHAKTKVSEFCTNLELVPTEATSIKWSDPQSPLDNPKIKAEINKITNNNANGETRIIVRKSGTEAKLRLLVESPTTENSKQIMQLLLNAICPS